MKLARHIIDNLAEILGGIKINRIEDKEAKAALLKNFLALRKVAKEAEADRNEIVRKFQEDWADEIPTIEKFRKAGEPVIGHLDYLEAERDANKAIGEIFANEVEVEIEPIRESPLYNPDCWDINIKAADIPGAIDYLKDNGVIKE